jgi:phage replication O-like protein O
MAKDLEDGYTRIANEVLEDLSKCKFLCIKSRIVLAVIRNTWGWKGHPTEREMSQTYLANAIDAPLDSVKWALKDLTKLGMIERHGSTTKYDKHWVESHPVENPTQVESHPLPGLNPTQNLGEIPPTKKEKKEKRKKGPIQKSTSLTEDFSLSNEMTNFAVWRGLQGKAIEEEFEKFKAYHIAKGSTMKRWDMAWRTWVLNWKKFNQGKGQVDKFLKINNGQSMVRLDEDLLVEFWKPYPEMIDSAKNAGIVFIAEFLDDFRKQGHGKRATREQWIEMWNQKIKNEGGK